MSKITQEIAQRIIDEFCQGSSTYELGDKYDLWQTSICNLISGRSWPNCVRPANIKVLIRERRHKGLHIGRSCIEAPPLTGRQTDIIVGSILGDGTISKPRTNSRFRKKQSADKLAYLEWLADELRPYAYKVSPIKSKEKLIGGSRGRIASREAVEEYLAGHCVETVQHPTWTALYHYWYPGGKKQVPSDLTLNPFRIAIWFFDDGANHADKRTAILCTQSFTLEEADFLLSKLKDFDITGKVTKRTSTYTGREMPILKFTKAGYDNLIHLVKPYMLWDCFRHKVEWRPAKRQWEYSGKFTEEEAREVIRLRETHSAREIAKMKNVHVNTIYALVSGRSWGHLKGDTDAATPVQGVR